MTLRGVEVTLRLARKKELDTLVSLFEACNTSMYEAGIYQWNAVYPNRATFIESISKGQQFLMTYDEVIVGAVILNEDQSTEWSQANWQVNSSSPLMIHALAIHPKHQGRGYGKKLLQVCEAWAKAHDYTEIRLDAFSENEAAVSMYEKNGYKRVGTITLDFKPLNHQIYYCYEKSLLEEATI